MFMCMAWTSVVSNVVVVGVGTGGLLASCLKRCVVILSESVASVLVVVVLGVA